LASATQTIRSLKDDIKDLTAELASGADSPRGFRELVKDWILSNKCREQPVESGKILALLKRADKDFVSQNSRIGLLQAQFLAATPDLKTPAYVVDDLTLDMIVANIRDVVGDSGAKILYSVKANAVAAVLERLAPLVDGFSCSSLPEVEIVRRVTGAATKIHFVGPGVTPEDADMLLNECERVSFNSLSLYKTYGIERGLKCGLRVNPHISLNKNPKYDPCRPNSKLGISIYELKALFQKSPEAFDPVDGLHVHNATGLDDFNNLAATVNIIAEALPELMEKISWINLGGGYRIHASRNSHVLSDTVKMLRDRFDLTVYIEPGTALVGKACTLVSSVIDIFPSEGRNIAVLDTSINHQLEGFIYNFPPNVANASASGRHTYLLAGASCLAGDLLGEHAFNEPLEIGSRVVFPRVGAYTHAFTTRYNGLNPPSIYQLQPNHDIKLRRQFGIDDFANACGI